MADLVAAAADVALLAQPGHDPATANRTRRTPAIEHNEWQLNFHLLSLKILTAVEFLITLTF